MSKKCSSPPSSESPSGDVLVFLCHLRLELGGLVPELKEDIAFRSPNWTPSRPSPPPRSEEIKTEERGRRAMEEVSVETYASKAQSRGPSREASAPPGLPALEDVEEVAFFTGNPFVEKTEGILRLWKAEAGTAMGSGGRRSLMVAMLAIPASQSSQDLLKFLEPVARTIEAMRIIRTASTAQYIMLLTFRSQAAADAFYGNYNGVPFNGLEPDACHLVYVASVHTERDAVPVEGATELPTCPVCLERMEESVDGILTILCNHAFHAQCLLQWQDSSCPVCRFVQSPDSSSSSTSACAACGKREDLWICLICGHVGCGRYAEAHAHRHFQHTAHTYSLQVGTQRVWDYAGDNYVHRLIQTKEEGKVVEYEPQGSACAANIPRFGEDEKVESLELEFTHLLTTQLDSQRKFFEGRVEDVETAASERISDLERRLRDAEAKAQELSSELGSVKTEKSSAEKRLGSASARLAKAQTALEEEAAMSSAVMGDQSQWRQKVKRLEVELSVVKAQKDKEVAELQEQVRDMMFHFEAQAKLQNEMTDEVKEEVQETGTIHVQPKPQTPRRRGKK